MNQLLFVSGLKRKTLKKAVAGFIIISLNLSVGGIASIFTSTVAYAVNINTGYAITGTSTVSGTTVSLSGTASANTYTGASSAQHMGVDWTGACGAASAVQFGFNTISFVGGTGPNQNNGSFTNATWSTSHDYGAAGTYSICVKVYHANFSGNEGSDAATFSTTIVIPPVTNLLTVTKSGTGSGSATSVPAGISCGADCSEAYTEGTSVTLTATPLSGSTFSGWSGACSGTGTCSVSMATAASVTASFNLIPIISEVCPSGFVGIPPLCIPIVIDVCPNDEGVQISLNQCTPVLSESSATVIATKVVCNNESDLPNWSGTNRVIDANTASQYVVSSDGACHLEAGWNFQWAPVTALYPGDTFIGEAPLENGWTTFGPTNASGVATVSVPFSGESMVVWVREALKDGYIPFTFQTDNNNVSAEIYCNSDVVNYDNYDNAVAANGGTEYCVAFNAPKVIQPPQCESGTHLMGNECVSDEPQQCVVSELSLDRTSGTSLHVGSNDGANAVLVDFDTETAGQQLHGAWTASIAGAEWVWGENPVATPGVEQTESFFDVFSIAGSSTGAHLKIAGDNTFQVYLNGVLILEDTSGATFGAPIDLDIAPGQLVNGQNTLEVRVKNFGVEGSNGQSNPAGILYDLHVTYNTICDQVPPVIPSIPSTPSGGGSGGSSTFDYFGCTNTAASNFNALANKDDGSCKLSGGNGGGSGSGGSTDNSQGEVLGAATTTGELALPAGCSEYIHTYMRKSNKKNDTEDVSRLQTFLNETVDAKIPVSGFFGTLTHKWVKKFQKQYHNEIIKPWYDAGYKGKDIENGTGYVYKTTKYEINLLKCKELNTPFPDLTPDIK